MTKRTVMLIILDGWGVGDDYPGNGIRFANTSNYDRLISRYPSSALDVSGLEVGLPYGQMGNSEVGHLNIGAGRVVYQELPRISNAIKDGSFFAKKEFIDVANHAKKNNSKVHLMGLVSDGGVHSHIEHLYGLLELMKRNNQENVFVHAFLDGRDVPPTIGKEHLIQLSSKMDEIGVGKIATVSGRYYAMDRDKRWDRTKLAYDAITKGIGNMSTNPILAIEDSYDNGINDEFIIPTVIIENGSPVATVDEGDAIIFFNFRPDRARQLTRAFLDKNFSGFQRERIKDLYYVTMTEYDKTIENKHVAYKGAIPENTISQYISEKGLKQLKIAETEKYAHVTFFFNGGIEEAYENEDRVLIPSPKVATYDLKPEMSAIEVKDEVIKRLNMDEYDLIVLNFANPDMVGHTGVIPAVIKAIETVDMCLGEIVEVLVSKGGKALITADHGNAEKLLDDLENPVTAHTTNKVPLIFVGEEDVQLRNGKLADLAPTLLELLNLDKPAEMTGQSLIIR